MILHRSGASRRLTPTMLAGFVLALGASLAACGGASSSGNDGVVSLATPTASPDPAASPTASLDPEDAMQAFTACMKEHGVDIGVAVVADSGTGGTISGPSVSGSAPGTAGKPQTGGGTEFDPKTLEAADEACRDLLPSGMQGDPNATIPPEQVEQLLAFAKCMRDHGFDFPDPQFSGNGL